MEFNPTNEQRKNLETLADYLTNLPKDYKGFAITSYAGYQYEDEDEMYIRDESNVGRFVERLAENPCGACACAIGHGVIAGISVNDHLDFSWSHYARRVFGTDEGSTKEGIYMFGLDNPDCPFAAADRIRKVLNGEFNNDGL